MKKYFYKDAHLNVGYAKKYFDSIGMFSCKNLLFFDSGWNGSSQFLLDRLLEAMGCDIENSLFILGYAIVIKVECN